VAFAAPAKPTAITANNRVVLMNFIFSPLNFAELIGADPAASAGIFADV
jgi:hypothetical protein